VKYLKIDIPPSSKSSLFFHVLARNIILKPHGENGKYLPVRFIIRQRDWDGGGKRRKLTVMSII
jgi:hypothetical protein